MDINLILGSAGAGIVLVAFLMSNNGSWKVTTPAYDFLNMLGSILLLIYAISTVSVPFIITNIVWTIFSGWDLISYFFKRKAK